MQEHNPYLIFTKKFNTLGVPYMVTGSVASILYGEPRLTHDVDVVLELVAGKISLISELFPADDFYTPPEEVIKIEAGRALRGHFNIIHFDTGYKADIYLAGRDPLHEWGLKKRRELVVSGSILWVAPPEYVIIRKLEYYREGKSEKHLTDIASILRVSLEQIDIKELERIISERGLEEELASARRLV